MAATRPWHRLLSEDGDNSLSFFWFLHRCARICFHDDINFCSRFELSFLTFLVGHHILDANLSIQFVRVLDINLGLLRLA